MPIDVTSQEHHKTFTGQLQDFAFVAHSYNYKLLKFVEFSTPKITILKNILCKLHENLN